MQWSVPAKGPGHLNQRIICAQGSSMHVESEARLVQSCKRATVAQITEKGDAGRDRKVSEHVA